MSDAGLTYAVEYADAAANADVYYVPAACAALELAARANWPGLRKRQLRLRSALDHSDTPESAELLRNAADAIALAAGDNNAGERFLREATDANPNSVVRWMALAEFRHRIQSFELAIAAFEEAAQREPAKRFRAHAYERIAEIFVFDLNDRVPAFESFLVSFVCWQGSASVLAQLEDLYELLGREAELPDTYRLAITFTEDNPAESEHDLSRLRQALAATG
jgi:tetratricopeptide (TPR) repeat protein